MTRVVHPALAAAAAAALAPAALGGAISISAVVLEGDAVAGVGTVTRIDNLAINDSGQWLVEVDTDHPDTNADSALLKDGVLLLREGQALTLPAGASLDSFDAVTLNNAGDSGWNFFLDGTTGTTDDSGIYLNDTLVLQEGAFSSAAFGGPTPYLGFFETKINNTGVSQILVMASVDDPTIPSSVDRALVILQPPAALFEILVAKESDILPGQTERIEDFETGPHNFAFNDAGQVLFIAELAGDAALDHAVYRDGTLLAQEGSPSPVTGRNWSSLSLAEVDLNNGGEYVISGSLDGDTATNLLIERSGAKVVQEGDSLPAFGPFLLTTFGTGPVLINDQDEVVWYGDWDDPDTTVDSGLFLDDQLLVREGVTMIDGQVIDTIASVQDAVAVSDNGRYIIFEGTLVGGIDGAFVIDLGTDCLGDTDGDGEVGGTDLVNVILDWGTDGSANGGDVDGSGTVDGQDLVAVILNWGSCPSAATCSGATCGRGEFCQKAIGDCDGTEGTCMPFGGGCGGQWDPVCGCDGQTYSNLGCAYAAGMNVAHVGECP